MNLYLMPMTGPFIFSKWRDAGLTFLPSLHSSGEDDEIRGGGVIMHTPAEPERSLIHADT